MDPIFKETPEQMQPSERYGLIFKSSKEEPHLTDAAFRREARVAWNKIQKRYDNPQKKPRDRKWPTARAVKVQEKWTDKLLDDTVCHVNAVPTAPPVDDLDLVIEGYITQQNNLTEQLAIIQSREEHIEQVMDIERKKLTEFFTLISDIIADKKKQLLKRLEEKYRTEKSKSNNLLRSVEHGLKTVNSQMVLAGDAKTKHGHSSTELIKEMTLLLRNIKSRYEERRLDLGKQYIHTVEINQAVIDTVSELTYATITEEVETDTNAESDIVRQRSEFETSDTSQRPLVGLESSIVRSHTVANNNTAVTSVDNPANNDTATPFVSRIPTENSSTAEVRQCPSAPAVSMEPPPPSYLEAVTFRIPYTHSASPGIVSSYSMSNSVAPSDMPVRRPKQLFCLQNISLVERKDIKSPRPAAIVWKFGKIYVADKANCIVKFCTPPASWVLSEKYFYNFEMNDIAVLEMGINGLCFVVSSPRSLQFINIVGPSSHDVKVRRVKLSEGYTSIAKGPSNNTIVGANALPNVGNPRIDIVDLNGQVVKSFTKTHLHKKFVYPRCVEVFNDKIIVADWKLNLVVMFHEDGHCIGQYSGTPLHPLSEPISLTLDHVGNPLVLSGLTADVHVMDSQCRPLEIIKFPAGDSIPVMIAFDIDTHRIAGVRPSGVVAIYDFKDS